MEVEIYADVIFLINFIMDLTIFAIMSKLIKKVPLLRLLIGSAVASLSYCLLMILRSESFFSAAFFCILSILVCFRPRGIYEALKLVLCFAAVSFFMGGTASGLFYFFSGSSLLNGTVGRKISLGFLAAAAAVIYIGTKAAVKLYKNNIIKKRSICSVTVYLNHEKATLNALIDTGNSLCEPISRSPVIIAEYSALKNILPEEAGKFTFENIEKISEDFSVRLIPFSAVGIKHGILLGISTEKAEIYSDKLVTVDKPIVAVYEHTLSGNGSYNALLNPEMLTSQGTLINSKIK